MTVTANWTGAIPTTEQHVALMRAHAKQLRDQADRYEAAAASIEGAPAPTTKPKAAREGRQETRPTRAGPTAGKTRQRVQEYLAKHPGATATEIGHALGMKAPAVAYHLTALRK